MSSRRIAIGLAAVVAAFLVAFGLGKATGDSEAGAPSGRAEAIEAPEARISARAPARAKLPALKRERRTSASSPSPGSSGGATSGSSSPPPQEQPATPEPANPPPQSGSGGSGAVTGGGVN